MQIGEHDNEDVSKIKDYFVCVKICNEKKKSSSTIAVLILGWGMKANMEKSSYIILFKCFPKLNLHCWNENSIKVDTYCWTGWVEHQWWLMESINSGPLRHETMCLYYITLQCIDWDSKRGNEDWTQVKGKWYQNLQLWLRNGLKLPAEKVKFLVFAIHPAVHNGGGSVAVGVNDMWQVTGDMQHATLDTWHVTPDTWQADYIKKKQ